MADEHFDAKIVVKPRARRVDWHESRSPYGYVLGEVISAMGKEIRRGKAFNAAYWAHQMAISGEMAEDFLWERLRVHSIEDCGPANPTVLTVVTDAMALYYSLPAHTDERFQVATFAVVVLARSPKTHFSCELFTDMKRQLRDGRLRPKIPDYAIDYHTKRGRERGRDELHFLTEGWRLAEEDRTFPQTHRRRLLTSARKVKRQRQKSR